MKKTAWFGPKRKPDLIGVYQTSSEPPGDSFQYWNGKYWGRCAGTVEVAAWAAGKGKSLYQQPKWRGLAQDPGKVR